MKVGEYSVEIYSLLAAFGLIFSFVPLMIFNADHTPLHDASLVPRNDSCHDRYHSTMLISLPMLCPLLLDTLLDYINTSTTYNVELNRFCLLLSFFIPNLTIYVYTGTHPTVFVSVIVAQQICLLYFLMHALSMCDSSFWSIRRINVIFGFQTAYYVAVTSYFAELEGLVYLVFMGYCGLLYFFYLYVKLVRKYWDLIFATEGLSLEDEIEVGSGRFHHILMALKTVYHLKNLSCDQINCLLYSTCTMALMILSVVLPATRMPPVDYYELGSYIGLAFFVLLTIVPGRLARLMVTESDKKLDDRKAFVQYLSREARGPLQVALMGLELHGSDISEAISTSPDTHGMFTDDVLRKEWFLERLGHVDEVTAACNMSHTILNDMLTFDKLEGGLMNVEKTTFHIGEFISSECAAFGIQARFKNIKMIYNLHDQFHAIPLHDSFKNIAVHADRHKLSQALRNYLSNALKFSSEYETITVRRRVMYTRAVGDGVIVKNSDVGRSYKSEGDMMEDVSSMDAAMFPIDGLTVRIEVTDCGVGIDQVKLQSMFRRPKKMDANVQDSDEGGLGLWLAKKIVQVHGGKVGVYSSGVGQGSTFYFELPIDSYLQAGSYDSGELPKASFRLEPNMDDEDESKFDVMELDAMRRKHFWEKYEHEQNDVKASLLTSLVDSGPEDKVANGETKVLEATVAPLGQFAPVPPTSQFHSSGKESSEAASKEYDVAPSSVNTDVLLHKKNVPRSIRVLISDSATEGQKVHKALLNINREFMVKSLTSDQERPFTVEPILISNTSEMLNRAETEYFDIFLIGQSNENNADVIKKLSMMRKNKALLYYIQDHTFAKAILDANVNVISNYCKPLETNHVREIIDDFVKAECSMV